MQPRGARRLSRKTNASLPRYLFFRRTCYVTHRSFSRRSFSPAFVLHCELVAKPAKEQRGYTEASTKQKEQRELRTFARVGCRSRTSICDGRCLTSPRGLAPSAQGALCTSFSLLPTAYGNSSLVVAGFHFLTFLRPRFVVWVACCLF